MALAREIQDLVDSGPLAFEEFSEYLDREWIAEALQSTLPAKIRNRALPALMVVWLVVGMGLFRNTSIAEVVAHLGVSGVGGRGPRKRRLASSSISEARDRVGEHPLEWLFMTTGQVWGEATSDENRLKGLALFAADGTTLRAPDSTENREAFGLPGSSRGQAGYPQVRVVALLAIRSHVLTAAALGPIRGEDTGEQSLARELWAQVPDKSLTILDKGYLNYAKLFTLQSIGLERYWLVRAKGGLRWTVIRELGPGDLIVEVKTTAKSRAADPSLPRAFQCRAICYQIEKHRPSWLLTSLMDHEHWPAVELARLYHERWEVELGYDEIKTHLLEREEALRSRTPAKVRQEIWGILLAYNLIRMKMMDVASKLNLPPTRLSFTHAMRLIRVFCEVKAWIAAPTKVPSRIEELGDMLELLVLPERRPGRRYPRHVKIKMTRFKCNPGRP